MSAEGLRASEDKMRAAGVAGPAIAAFARYYRRLAAGESGMLPERGIEPVEELPDAESLPEPSAAEAAAVLDRAVAVRLNGGLGTSMGMTRAKSLLPVKDGLTFLDVIVGQVLALRERHGARLPLVLMNSFATREDTLAALAAHPGLPVEGLPLDFLQSREPKLLADGLTPATWPANPALEWCPPGHGDLYASLLTSGMLGALRERGIRWAFVANSDNLGARLDPRILAWVAREEVPFAMEAADRTEADRKGGHLAHLRDGRLVLRESAQTPAADADAFQDIARHRFFNTNNLWVDLDALDSALREREGVLGLPAIFNRKTLDPRDPASPPVVQIETAMGAAISVFPGARALRVPRSRLVPVKTTSDLLVLRSDRYEIAPDGALTEAAGATGEIFVELDPDHYKLLDDFEARFPAGPPSLLACERLEVAGDVTFGRDVVARGRVSVSAAGGPARIADGAELRGAIEL
ncbi:MAG: UTP--glucose-1-phosphate uridylyltransferase [Solirubrobacteraceae bacterium]